VAVTPSDVVLVRKRLPAEERRALILEVSRGLFAQNGFHATGTIEIAAAAGCSEPIIYKHFASKQALFAAVVEDCALEMRAMLDQTLVDHPDPLDAYAAFARRFVSEPRFIEITRLRTLALSLVHEPEVLQALLRLSEMMRGRWAANLCFISLDRPRIWLKSRSSGSTRLSSRRNAATSWAWRSR